MKKVILFIEGGTVTKENVNPYSYMLDDHDKECVSENIIKNLNEFTKDEYGFESDYKIDIDDDCAVETEVVNHFSPIHGHSTSEGDLIVDYECQIIIEMKNNVFNHFKENDDFEIIKEIVLESLSEECRWLGVSLDFDPVVLKIQEA